jgi:hypothetical protein
MKKINIKKIATIVYYTLTTFVLLWIIGWFIVHNDINIFTLTRKEYIALNVIPKLYGYIYLGICILCAIPMSFSKR